MTKVVKMAVLNDIGAFSDPKEEYKNLVKRYRKFLAPAKVVAKHLMSFSPDPGTNLILFDFGGMLPGCGDLIKSNVRQCLQWAEDNPKGLLVVVSECTWMRHVEAEMQEMGLKDAPNIILDKGYDETAETVLPEWFRNQFK